MKKYFLLIFFLFSLDLSAQESFMSNYDSTQAGINHELLEACRGDYRKIGNEIKKEIKKLSETDYKVFIKAFREEKNKGYETPSKSYCREYAINAQKENERYIKDLRKKVNGQTNEKSTISNQNPDLKIFYPKIHRVNETNNRLLDSNNTWLFGYQTAIIFNCDDGNSKLENYANNTKDFIKKLSQIDFKDFNDGYESFILGNESCSKKDVEIKIKDIDEFKEFVWKSVHEYDESTQIDIVKSISTSEDKIEKKEAKVKLEKKIDPKIEKKELIEAQNYINDLLLFIENSPAEFDILEITKLMVVGKKILNDKWNKIEKDGFIKIQDYASKSYKFNEFLISQNKKRIEDFNNKLLALDIQLNNYIDFYKNYLIENVTSDLAEEILNNISEAQVAITSKDKEKKEIVVTKFLKLSSNNNLSKAFDKFSEPKINKNNTSDKKENNDNKFVNSKEELKEIQSILKKLGFYQGVVDGIFGNASIKALNEWQKENNLIISKIVTTGLLNKLKESSKNITAVEENNEIVKITNEPLQNEEQKLAIQYLKDFLKFIESNQTNFDIIELTELITVNKSILDGSWNEIQQKDFKYFQEFTSSSDDFLDFHEEQNKERKKQYLNDVAEQSLSISNIINFMKDYLAKNITSNFAPDIVENIKYAEFSLEDQSLSNLISANKKLKEFLSSKKILNDYNEFSKTLDKKNINENQIAENPRYDILDLELISQSNDKDLIVLVNLSGKAPNALLNLEGKVLFENDEAVSCFYQTEQIDNELKFYIFDRISNRDFNIYQNKFECDQRNLLDYDLIIFQKNSLLKENKSYLAPLLPLIFEEEFQKFLIITNNEYEEDFIKRKIFAEQIVDEILNEARIGYGALVVDNNSTMLCTDVDETLGQIQIINSLSNEFIRMGFKKEASDVTFSNTEDTFKSVQRESCGFIYASETSLSLLINALNKSRNQFKVVPIWLSPKQIANAQKLAEEDQKNNLVNLQKLKENIEKENKLKEERLKADGIIQAQKQKELREKNRNVVEAHIKDFELVLNTFFNKNEYKETWIYKMYPKLGDFIEKKFKEKWEIDSFNISIIDYGKSNYKNRKIDTFIQDLSFQLLNKDLGEYENFCFRLAVISDIEFDRWRESEIEPCYSNIYTDETDQIINEKNKDLLDIYKKRLDFISDWNVSLNSVN